MSFLSLLFFVSVIYFAQGRPESSEAFKPVSVPITSSVSAYDASMYNAQLAAFMEEMSKAVDEYMMPVISQLDEEKQDELFAMGMNGFASYVNYIMQLLREQEKEFSAFEDHDDYGEYAKDKDHYYNPDDEN